MTPAEIQEVESDCEDQQLPSPAESLLANREWEKILEPDLGNWSLYRWPVFGILSKYMTVKEYCSTLRFLWSHSEGAFDDATFMAVFEGQGQFDIAPIQLMTPAEQHEFDLWGNPVTVYRGCNHNSIMGRSWTTRQIVAQNFAADRGASESPNGIGLVVVGQCPKHNILCYINTDLLEHEILVASPSAITITAQIPVHEHP